MVVKKSKGKGYAGKREKMRRRFLKNTAAVVMMSLVVSTCCVNAFAETKDNDQKIETNEGDIGTNTEQGAIGTNKGDIGTNEGYVGTNEGNIGTNKGTVETNDNGAITDNRGIVGDNYGLITENNAGSAPKENGSDSKDEDTSGEGSSSGVLIEEGPIGEVPSSEGAGGEESSSGGTSGEESSSGGTSGEESSSGGTSGEESSSGDPISGGSSGLFSLSLGTSDGDTGGNIIEESGIVLPGVKNNYGWIEENNGYVENNTSTEKYNNVSQMNEQYSGTIKWNNGKGYVENNETEIKFNLGTVETNKGNIGFNSGTVKVNTKTGVISNYDGGVVKTNEGTVYNEGGKVENNVGTEYFQVKVSGEGLEAKYDGFTEYRTRQWLGQTGSGDNVKTSTAEVTVTALEGYNITEFTISDEYKDYVTAVQNDDGSWSLTVVSGYNISLTPVATLIGSGDNNVVINVDVSSDSGDDGNSGNKQPSSGQDNLQSGSPNDLLMATLTVNSFDFLGQGLTVSLSEVLTTVDKYTAISNFTAQGITASTDNILTCGIVDFKNAFVNAATGSVDVPVPATVIAGNTYTVVLSNGTTIPVLCTADGVLYIPFASNTQNLTFIIYGLQMDPSAMIGMDLTV